MAANRGLGALLWLSWQVLKVEDMYATFFVIAILGAGLSYGLAALRVRLTQFGAGVHTYNKAEAGLPLGVVPAVAELYHKGITSGYFLTG